jgi:hypothetical protein
MEVLDRDDVVFAGGGSFTYKKMGNGEERRRVVFPAGTRVSETIAADWNPVPGMFPWQDAHYHEGLTEHYFVQHGWVGFLFETNGKLQWKKVEAGSHICFDPKVPHAVLMGPKSVMATILVGISIGNPDRKNDDWWPAADFAGYAWELEKLRVEETIA